MTDKRIKYECAKCGNDWIKAQGESLWDTRSQAWVYENHDSYYCSNCGEVDVVEVPANDR